MLFLFIYWYIQSIIQNDTKNAYHHYSFSILLWDSLLFKASLNIYYMDQMEIVLHLKVWSLDAYLHKAPL